MASVTVCLSVYLCVCPLSKRKTSFSYRETTTPNFVHIYSMVRPRHAFTLSSKGQRSRSHGYENRHRCTVASGGFPSPLLRPRAAAAADDVGLHVVRLLRFLVILYRLFAQSLPRKIGPTSRDRRSEKMEVEEKSSTNFRQARLLHSPANGHFRGAHIRTCLTNISTASVRRRVESCLVH